MNDSVISSSSLPRDMVQIGLALHEILNRLPVTVRTRDHRGIRIEDGQIVDTNYSGPVLEEVLATNRKIQKTPEQGPYRGVPVIVAPVRDNNGDAIAAIGVVDITGIFDLATLMEHQSAILKQVCGKDPCPLPGEQIGAKR